MEQPGIAAGFSLTTASSKRTSATGTEIKYLLQWSGSLPWIAPIFDNFLFGN